MRQALLLPKQTVKWKKKQDIFTQFWNVKGNLIYNVKHDNKVVAI